ISRSLVELMGGRIDVESEPGMGSRFSIELVLARAPLDDTADIEPAAAAGEDLLDFEIPLHVLLVEDHEVNRKVATEMIESLGCGADAVADGEAAVAALEGTTYDVVLMDVQLPGIDGLATTAEIRQREAGTGRHQPIVALTANAMEGDRERCLDAGMDEYLA